MENVFQEIIDKPMRLCNKCSKCHGVFPTSFFEKLPEGCGFEGWFFQKREEIKQKVRKQKEILLDCETELLERQNAINTPDLLNCEITEKINNIKTQISVYQKYGSEDW